MDSKNKFSLRVLDGQTELAEEELQRLTSFFSKWSKEILTAAAIAGVAFLAIHFFKDADLRQRKTSAQKFADLRGSYQELLGAVQARAKATGDDVKKSQDKIDDAKSRLGEQIKVMGDTRDPYKTVGSLYQALILLQTNDVEGAKTLLSSLDVAGKLATQDSGNLMLELTAVTLGRTLIDAPASYTDGWNLLRTIALQGKYADVQALKSLQILAASDAEKKDVSELKVKVLEKHPEAGELVGE